jgi:tetratricopeptide (TPR) repeat protein
VVLAGHCHERESLPYKAIDPLIDDLTTFLLHLDRRNGSPAYPTDIGALARLFPVLNRIPAIEQADRTALEALDVRAVRRLAFQALRALLLDLAERRPVVLLLDDLQWSDVDSVELIAALLEPPAVPALVLLMYRPDAGEGTAQHEALAALHPQDETMRADRRGRFLEFDPRLSFDDLELGPLDSGTIEEMAGHLLGDRVRRPTLVGAAPDDPRQETPAASIAREADGSPLFAIELARYHAEQRALGVPVAARVSLDEVLRMRLSRLSDGSRALLELISLAGKPTPLGVIHGAAQLGAVERPALARLRASYFVRTSGDSSLDHVDTLHNRIRDVVLDGLGPSRRRAHHAALAESLERQSATAPDVDALATHFLGAGDDTRALPWALKAAERAAAAYAHHDAIGHFDAALRILEAQADAATGTPDEDEAWRAVDAVRREAAESARQAGAYGRAHVLLEECLRRAERSTGPSGRVAQADLHASLGQVSQERGDAEGAIVRLETALRMYGRPPPANLFVLGLETAWQLLRHLTTRLEGEPQREIDPTLQKQADTLFGLIRIYYFVDIAKVTWAGLRVVNLARRLPRAGDRALAWSFYGVLLFGTGLLGQSRALCERALTLARSSASPVSEAVILLRLGTQAMFANDLDRATAVLDESITKFKSIGEMWELQTALMIAATTRFIRGELTAAEPIYEEMGGYGRQLNAIMHQAWALAWAPFSRYLRGVQQAEQTRVDIERAIELSASASDLANTVASLMHLCSLEVREGRVEASASIAVRAHGAVSRYLVGVPFLQRCWIDAAEAALFALEQGARNEPRGKLLAIARQAVRRTRLLARFYPYLRGPSLYVRARLTAHTRGAAAAEPIYDRAIGALEGTPHRWELGVVLLDAARVLPHRRADLASRARQSFEAMGAHREVARVERLYDSD